MNRRRLLILLLAAAPAALGPPAWRLAVAQTEPTKAQPTLPTQKLVIVTHDGKHHDFTVEMATELDQQTTGLMFRTSVPPDGGMLFDWGVVKQSDMWMENTLVPLDMLFIDADGTIRHIAENTVPRSLAVIDSVVPVRATLELAGGTAEKLDIRVGDKVLNSVFHNLS